VPTAARTDAETDGEDGRRLWRLARQRGALARRTATAAPTVARMMDAEMDAEMDGETDAADDAEVTGAADDGCR